MSEHFGFTCTRCGDCCRGLDDERAVIVRPSDLKRLAEHLGADIEEAKSRYCRSQMVEADDRQVEVLFLRDRGGACVFLGTDNTCTIHDAKPEQCKRGPIDFLWDGKLVYACLRDAAIPPEHNTSEQDEEFFDALIAESDTEGR